jgi:hypothetical protein
VADAPGSADSFSLPLDPLAEDGAPLLTLSRVFADVACVLGALLLVVGGGSAVSLDDSA